MFFLRKAKPQGPEFLPWHSGINIQIVHHARARRYLLQLKRDGTPRLTIPRGGSRSEALRFLAKSEARLQRQLSRHPQHYPWREGACFYYRGESTSLRVEEALPGMRLRFGDQVIFTPRLLDDYQPIIQSHLRSLAEQELPDRTRAQARHFGISISRITVRNQKTRWGSCSNRGVLSLNWRLIQTPPWVTDYIIIHELMHRREMNHSAAFWHHVAAACPDYLQAEQWLKKHSRILWV